MAAATNTPSPSQFDVVFEGTWIFVPTVDSSGNIVGVDVYSPSCGHPHAALFLPQLGPFTPQNFPPLSSFYMLDNHGLTLAVDRSSGKAGMPATGINQPANHCIHKSRPLTGSWDVLVSINAGPDAWVSTGTQPPVTTDPSGNKVPCFSGVDAPAANISTIQTLSFKGVNSAALCGAPQVVQQLIPSPFTGSGSLLFEGEVPYIPTLHHERSAVTAMASLGGLDLLLQHPLPSSGSAAPNSILKPRIQGQASCGHAIIFVPVP